MQRGLDDRYEDARRRYEQSVPMQRACQPDDIAAAIVSLIGGSSLVTGQTLVVDGGAIIADTSLQAVRNSP
jgi:NAD(P)-dependent dehydrogenase (short-subunit alcohol dehydrogenase family)